MTPAVLLAAALVALQPSVLVDRSGAFLSTSAFNELRALYRTWLQLQSQAEPR